MAAGEFGKKKNSDGSVLAPPPAANWNDARRPCAVVVYQGQGIEALYGEFETEQDALDWCAEKDIDVGAAILDDDQRRGLMLPLNPPD